jgi:hypothetical protein
MRTGAKQGRPATCPRRTICSGAFERREQSALVAALVVRKRTPKSLVVVGDGVCEGSLGSCTSGLDSSRDREVPGAAS